ncbi:MAG: hypothetical protein R3192_00575 [Woeseiaceae bacterium]|nr:hypothetical protein [Woeseiaceae bacterium]
MIPDFLQTIAEISIGLAGFSGLIVALRKSPGPLTEVQKFRLKVLFGNAFGAMFLSLLPYLLSALHVPNARIWFDASAAMLGFSLIFGSWIVVAGRRIARVVPEIFNWTIFYTLTGGHVVVVILQAAIMTGFIDERAPGVYAIGLTWYLMHATYQFSRMLFILPKDPRHV